jgi:hypothetical protein
VPKNTVGALFIAPELTNKQNCEAKEHTMAEFFNLASVNISHESV